jgi:predicted dehydrogenase
VEVGSSAAAVADRTGARAVVDVTVPGAHHAVNTEALFAGLPVLCEKPIAPTLARAMSLAAASEETGQLLMVSQSRRYYGHLAEFRGLVRGLGDIGLVTTEFFKAPHFGGFRDEMAHPLLVDMAIHAFDALRYLVDAEPVAVTCEAFNPSWSWYRGNAAATAVFELSGGGRYMYTGSWCSPGLETSWNGRWRVSGERGSATWDGENAPVAEPAADQAPGSSAPEEIAGALAEFVDALRTARTPSGEVHENVRSLAMVEGAVRAADTGTRVDLDELLEEAYREAVAAEERPAVRARLEGWGSASAGLGGARR